MTPKQEKILKLLQVPPAPLAEKFHEKHPSISKQDMNGMIRKGLVTKNKRSQKYRLTYKGLSIANALFPRRRAIVRTKTKGAMQLPPGGFKDSSVSKLVEHFVKLARKHGKSAATRPLVNLLRWDKRTHPKLSQKARAVLDKLKADPRYQDIPARSTKKKQQKRTAKKKQQKRGGKIHSLQQRRKKQQSRKTAAGRKRKQVRRVKRRR